MDQLLAVLGFVILVGSFLWGALASDKPRAHPLPVLGIVLGLFLMLWRF